MNMPLLQILDLSISLLYLDHNLISSIKAISSFPFNKLQTYWVGMI